VKETLGNSIRKKEMIVPIYFKTPDTVAYALKDALGNPYKDEDVRNATDKTKTILEKWIEYGEGVTLLFDTENETLTVKKIK
jgi:hypothetical protein